MYLAHFIKFSSLCPDLIWLHVHELKPQKFVGIEEVTWFAWFTDDYQECPSKRVEESTTINTFTDSRVKHPSDYSRYEGT